MIPVGKARISRILPIADAYRPVAASNRGNRCAARNARPSPDKVSSRLTGDQTQRGRESIKHAILQVLGDWRTSPTTKDSTHVQIVTARADLV